MKTKREIKDELEEIGESIRTASSRNDTRDVEGWRDALFWVLEKKE